MGRAKHRLSLNLPRLFMKKSLFKLVGQHKVNISSKPLFFKESLFKAASPRYPEA